MSKDKKTLQLGMNPSTASNRLVKDILWHEIVMYKTCHRRGNPMTRDDFSIEHITPWLDSEDPLGLYFDMNNISFSHMSCNRLASRGNSKTEEEKKETRKRYTKKFWNDMTLEERKSYRRNVYLRTGK